MTDPPKALADRTPVNQRLVGLAVLALAVAAAAGIGFSIHKTYVMRRLGREGVVVDGAITSWANTARRRGGDGGGPHVQVTYAFRFAGVRYADEAMGVDPAAMREPLRTMAIGVKVLPSDPAVHGLAIHLERQDWDGTIVGCVLMGAFSVVFGVVGVAALRMRPGDDCPPPPPAEVGAPRLAPAAAFFATPTPRAVGYRRGAVMWTAVWTMLILIPPAYAATRLHSYRATRGPRDSWWPWDAGVMAEAVLKGLPYFAVAVPLYVLRLARMRGCRRLARYGRPTTATVDWKRKRPMPKRPSATVDGVALGNPARADSVNWVPYRYEVDGREYVAEGPDGYGVFRRGAGAVAARLPTGMTVQVAYDPADPRRSSLLGYLRHHLDIPADERGGN